MQKGAPVDLLLGTDVHSCLGIVLMCDSSDVATDLLSNQCWSKKTDGVLVEPNIINAEPHEGTVKGRAGRGMRTHLWTYTKSLRINA